MTGKKAGSGKRAAAGRGSTKKSDPAEKSVKSPLWTPGGPLEITDAMIRKFDIFQIYQVGRTMTPLIFEGNVDDIGKDVDESELLEVLDDTLVPESSFEVFDLYRRSPEVLNHIILDSPAVGLLEPLTHDTVFVTYHDGYNNYVNLPNNMRIIMFLMGGRDYVEIKFFTDNFAYTITVPCEISYRTVGPTRYKLVRIPAQNPSNFKFAFRPYRGGWNSRRESSVGHILGWAEKSVPVAFY